MKKVFGILALTMALLVATNVCAQDKSIGVYFDTAGTQNGKTSTAEWGHPAPAPFDAYVIAFAEMVVGGAAFKLEMNPAINFVGASYPAGIQIGEIRTGIEIGLTNPVVGYFGYPVRLATVSIWPGWTAFSDALMCIVPWTPNYPDVTLSDNQGVLYPAEGRCAHFSVVVPGDETSWGSVKSLYQ